METIILIGIFLIQVLWICLWIIDKKTNKTNRILCEIEKHNLDIIHKLELIRNNTYNKKRSNKYRK